VDDQQGAARIALARQEAALALARSAYPSAQSALLAMVRSDSPGQGASIEALAIEPPRDMVFGEQPPLTPASIRLAGRIGDLRSLTSIESVLQSGDSATRAASLSTLAALGDTRVLVAARRARDDPDTSVRLAAAEVLVRLGDTDAVRAVAALIGQDDAVSRALELARDVQGDDVTRALAARASVTDRPEVRDAAVGALGRQMGALAVAALAGFMMNPALEGATLCALARSPSAAATSAIESLAARAGTRRNAVRAYFVRRSLRGEISSQLDALVGSLAESEDARDRAVAVQALVAFGQRSLSQALGDSDRRVRRGAVLGALGRLDARSARDLLARRESEPDAVTREVLSNGLVAGDSEALVSTQTLWETVRAGRADALLAARALVRRVGGRGLAGLISVDAMADPLMRAQVASALGETAIADATGRLVNGYRFEADACVRRAMVWSLAARARQDREAQAMKVLAAAARLDPDAVVRAFARRGLAGTSAVEDAGREVACLRAVPSEPSRPRTDLTATLVDADGSAVPFVFDEDGYALVPGIATGDAVVRLAPALSPYDADSP
jgi:hypothetical protein